MFSQQFGWLGLDVPDAKWKWIQIKIFGTPRTTVDYAFVGSSRTWCAIRSKQIENALGGATVWNLGRHWTGRDIDFVMIEELVKRHNVKHLFLEMIGQEDYAPHPYTKYIISSKAVAAETKYHIKSLRPRDVLTYSPFFKERVKHVFNYVAELSVRSYRAALFYGWSIIRPGHDFRPELNLTEALGGFYADDFRSVPKKSFTDQFGRFQPFYPVQKGPFIIPSGSFPEYYLQRISDICRENDTELSFVFVSDFAAVLPSDQMFHRFGQWGPLYIPTLRNIYKAEYWRDKAHVYQKGSEVFTDEIIHLLKNGVRASEDYRQYDRP